jgi:membrane protein implicated in regulation of membrane protease activity
MMNFRKLASIDIIFLGSKLIIAEFAGGVLLCIVLGTFVLVRGHSIWQLILGFYLISLGINYVPMLVYAVAITRGRSARLELGDELNDKRRAMAKYRCESILLLVPFLVPIIALTGRGAKSKGSAVSTL